MKKQSTGDAIRQFMKMTGCNQVFLYGGAAIDRYLNPDADIMDYDIAIKNPDDYVAALEKLRNQGFDVGNTRTAFNLATVAKHPEYGIFDLACMDIRKNGIYNLEKFYIEYSKQYPGGKAVDRYGTVGALREGRVIPINDPDSEKAYDLLRRFSVLAGKYGFSLKRDGINGDTISIIERRLQETPTDKKNEHSRVRCLARFIGAVVRSKNKPEFIRGMGQTGLMKYGYPEINNVLHNEQFIQDIIDKPLHDKHDVVNRMFHYSEHKDNFIDEISLLSKRERDREDPRVIRKVENLLDAKTTKSRLTNKVLNPVFAHILGGNGK